MFASHQKSIALAAWALLAASSAQAWTTNDINLILAVMPTGVVHQHQMVPMRDGVRLSTYCFLPPGHATTSYPVVLVRSAYNDWSQRATYANDVVNQSNPTNYTWINTSGYAYVFQDLRGDGESETNANFEPRLSDNEVFDTYDAVEALATNAWSNGRVGLYGSSGHGVAAYMGWFSGAPHLVVAAPGNTAPNLHQHWSFENGTRRWIYQWLQYRYPNNAVMPTWPKPTLGEYYTNSSWEQILSTGPISNRTILLASDTWHNYMLDSTFEALASLTTGNLAYLTMDPGTHQGNTSSNGLVFPKKPSTILNLPNVFQILDGAPFTNTPLLKYFVMGDARRANAEGNFYRFTATWPPGRAHAVLPARGWTAGPGGADVHHRLTLLPLPSHQPGADGGRQLLVRIRESIRPAESTGAAAHRPHRHPALRNGPVHQRGGNRGDPGRDPLRRHGRGRQRVRGEAGGPLSGRRHQRGISRHHA
jgi:hypothetical protein